MDLIEKIIGAISPRTALMRAFYREQSARVYEAAKSNPYHRRPGQQGSADKSMDQARGNIRDWARHLDENHDLAIGILDELVNKTVGAGIQLMPMVMDSKGVARRELNAEISRLWRPWTKRPEVTHEFNFTQVQRLMARTMYRDGEVLGQHVLGNMGRVVHAGRIPYSLEMIEPDFLPFELNDASRGIVHGVEKTAWGRPRAYHLHKKAPDNLRTVLIRPDVNDMKRVPAERMLHAKFVRRIGQTRGVSVFHGVAHRLDDIKDYEESERIAARIGASLAAYIKKGSDFDSAAAWSAVQAGTVKNRTMEMVGGMIFDDLLPGEEVGTIDTNRPNTNLTDYRDGQLKATAAGTGTRYSGISRNYDGSYSSMRQELTDSMIPYAALRDYIVSTILQPIYEQFITAAILSNQLAVPAGVDIEDMFGAGWIAPPQPWIDPKKEMEADALAVANHFVPWSQIVLQRTGRDPALVLEQILQEQEMLAKLAPVPVADPAAEPKATDDELEAQEDNDDEAAA